MADTFHIDINADVGEGIGNESEIMTYLSSCNIACGGHAGHVTIMSEVVRLANLHKVKIGAHPSFPDKANFGRVALNISAADLFTSLKRQISALQAVLRQENTMLHHIKPHGALYNLAAKDEKTANVIIEVVKSIPLPVKLYAPYNSVIAQLALEEGIEVVFEAFADRNYNEDLSLVSRTNENAILTNKQDVYNHVVNMLRYQNVKTINGVEVVIKASTFCVHGDTENATEILKYLNEELPKRGIQIL
jgi:5-oxoprolinase (ATP-hydrolysing) subunit A